VSPDSTTSARSRSAADLGFAVDFPDHPERLEQDQEWCILRRDGQTTRIRFHDYAQVFSVPGLYEHLFYERLECVSPQMMRSMLEGQLRKVGQDPAEQSILDVGAGNGMVGEELAEMGARNIVGIDLLQEAADAAARDRPGIYEEYLVADLTDLSDDELHTLRAHDFTCLTTVAALGFGDIPPDAFAEAYNLVGDGGWIAFNIKEEFLLDGDDSSGFSRLIESLIESGRLEIRARERYRHRYAVNGDPLMYVAMVGLKHDEATERLVEDAREA
jgi:predicted TPR repeat methyltransferase